VRPRCARDGSAARPEHAPRFGGVAGHAHADRVLAPARCGDRVDVAVDGLAIAVLAEIGAAPASGRKPRSAR